MLDNKLIKEILLLNGGDNKRLIVNDRYLCSFFNSDMTKIAAKQCPFSDAYKETTFPGITSFANVYVYDTLMKVGKHKSGFGKIFYTFHDDLGFGTFSLKLLDNTLINANDIKLEPEIIQLKTFMKLIDEKPRHKIHEPVETCGLAVVTFKDYFNKNVSASLEYSPNGVLYFEVIDWEGNSDMLLPLNSPRRKYVLNYIKLTKENAFDLADHINYALKERKTLKTSKGFDKNDKES